MAETIIGPTNVKISFRRKAEMERKMPATSQSMAKAMFAAKNGKSTLGIPKAVGEEFAEDLGPGDVKALPKRKPSRADRLHAAGKISDKQRARMSKDWDGDGA